MTYKILHGNNLDILPTLPDNSVDSIVTDPPYELGFMGKKWDSSGIAYSVELWRECLRVLKPGGHLLSFGGTRTWHRVAVGIEDAGFEIRDSMAWLYGSGFPKSLDISKAIDKRGGKGATLTLQIGEALKKARESRNISKSQADQMFCDGTTNWTWFEGRPAGQRPPTPETFARIVAEWKELQPLAEIVAEAEREVIGQKTFTRNTQSWEASGGMLAAGEKEVKETLPATLEAQQWQGWGTALKPAFEPIVVARKPIEGTVANNVLKWGTGGLNIDGSRIGSETISTHNAPKGSFAGGEENRGSDTSSYKTHTGRWPANIILDPYTAELLDEQSGQVRSNHNKTNDNSGFGDTYVGGSLTRPVSGPMYSDSGGASRFFYVAKASKRDRNEGLDELLETTAADMVDREPDSAGMNSPRAGAGRTSGAKNFHPTVKPTTLMEYLIKLVTPPGGVVLDPFTGSGSTGKAAILQGFDFIGIEMTKEYLPIIEGRLKHAEQEKKKKEAQEVLKQFEGLF
jgi:DNA modification methylase